jgi:hypothetical protein
MHPVMNPYATAVNANYDVIAMVYTAISFTERYPVIKPIICRLHILTQNSTSETNATLM